MATAKSNLRMASWPESCNESSFWLCETRATFKRVQLFVGHRTWNVSSWSCPKRSELCLEARDRSEETPLALAARYSSRSVRVTQKQCPAWSATMLRAPVLAPRDAGNPAICPKLRNMKNGLIDSSGCLELYANCVEHAFPSSIHAGLAGRARPVWRGST